MWRRPFRKENFRRHQEDQHAEFWAKYRVFSASERDNYFIGFNSGRIGSFFEAEGGGLVMYANATIVENILGDLFLRIVEGEDREFNDKLSELSKDYALRLFEKDPNPIPGGGERYAVQMKNKVRFRLTLRDVAAGMSFRQAAPASENVQEETGNNKLGGLSHGIVGDYVRIMLAVNLQVITDILDSRIRIGHFLLPTMGPLARVCRYLTFVFASWSALN